MATSGLRGSSASPYRGEVADAADYAARLGNASGTNQIAHGAMYLNIARDDTALTSPTVGHLTYVAWRSGPTTSGSNSPHLIHIATTATKEAKTAAPSPASSRTFDNSPYRVLAVPKNKTPFLQAKHIPWLWDAVRKRVYQAHGDYSWGAENFGQPGSDAKFTTNEPTNPGTYLATGYRQDSYSIDPYASTPAWRLEHPMLPARLADGSREYTPGGDCQSMYVYDSKRGKHWHMSTTLRGVYWYYKTLPDGSKVPDSWASGDYRSLGYTGGLFPPGVSSFTPDDTGNGKGQWTLESTAGFIETQGTITSPTRYLPPPNDNVLLTTSDERVWDAAYDPATDRIYSFGINEVYIYDIANQKFEYRSLKTPFDWYFSNGGAAVLDGYLYGIAQQRTGTSRDSRLFRVSTAALIGAANGTAVPITDSAVLPFSLVGCKDAASCDTYFTGIFDDRGEVWGIPWYNQETGVRAVAGKIVVLSTAVGSGGGLWPNRSRIAIFDPVTKAMTEAPTPPRHVWGNSWVALPDSGEILFGDNAAGIDSGMATGELFAIKVGATVKARRR